MPSLYYRQSLLAKLENHLSLPNPPIQVLLGPRQVGKTTAILSFLKKCKRLSFYHSADQISPPDTAWIEKQWIAARRQAKKNAPVLLVFDEVQKITRWSEAVKKFFDEDLRFKNAINVILLGSSSLLMQRGLTESLAGRFEIIHFPHWSYRECQEYFGINFDEYVFYGGYPGALRILLDSHYDVDRWKEYVRNALIEPVLNKDILLLTPVTKPALFRQVFQLSCAYAAQILSFNKMMGQLQEAGNASTIASYLKLLDAAMLLKPLEKYSVNKLRQKASSPKLLILNNALINATGEMTLPQAKQNHVFWGRLIENTVGASLINNNLGKNANLFYWRDRDAEVDFVLQRGETTLAVEVKTTLTKNLTGLNQFLKKFPRAKTMVTTLKKGDLLIEKLITMSADELFSHYPLARRTDSC